MRNRTLVTVILLWTLLASGKEVRAAELGAELRVYPAGLITGLRGDLALGRHEHLLIQLGYNLTDRRDWGQHAEESGGGGGLGLGWMHQFGVDPRGWIAGARLDYWRMDIDWKDPDREGSTRVTVLQPTATAGYRFASARWHFEATLSVGAEINLSTEGEAVGEGAIVLAGISALFQL